MKKGALFYVYLTSISTIAWISDEGICATLPEEEITTLAKKQIHTSSDVASANGRMEGKDPTGLPDMSKEKSGKYIKIIESKDGDKIDQAAYACLAINDVPNAIELYQALYALRQDNYTLGWLGVALLNADDEKSQKDGAGYMLKAASHRDPKALLFLSRFLKKDLLDQFEENPENLAIHQPVKTALLAARRKKAPKTPAWRLDF